MSSADKEMAWLNAEVIPEILKNGKLVENYNESSASIFKVLSIDIDIIGSEEAYMLTTCYRATIKFQYENIAQTVKLVIKKTPNISEEVFDSISFGALFENEISFYTRILPELQILAVGKFAAPKYYFSQTGRSFASIILSDFAADGFRMTKARVNLPLDHILLGSAYIGNFHALGYALKHTKPELFRQLTVDLKESRYETEDLHPEWKIIVTKCIDRLIEATHEYQPEIDKEFVAKLARLIGKYVSYGRQRVAPVEPFATLCHGDFLRNNMAYKYDASEMPQDIMMFDYQTVRVSSPMIDFSVFIALSAYAEVRHTHFDQIFDTYCNALSDTYTKITKQPLPDYLSRDSLLAEYVRYMPYGILITASFLKELVDPVQMSSDEALNMELNPEQIAHETMTRGGAEVDRELAQQVRELYDLSRRLEVDYTEGIAKY